MFKVAKMHPVNGENILLTKSYVGILDKVKNPADQCIYQGIINTFYVIMARATDDILIGTHPLAKYYHIVATLESHWKVHNLGIVLIFLDFGSYLAQIV